MRLRSLLLGTNDGPKGQSGNGQMEQPCLSKENHMRSSLRDEAREADLFKKSRFLGE